MRLVPLNTVFNISYGNQFDRSKMSLADTREEGVNFVSRASKNFGIVARVLNYNLIDPFPAGLITVTLGGSYLLASFVQPDIFYTAQNIKVLSPKKEMSLNEKLFYCLCIQKNRYRYSSHGREANVSIDSLLVPELMNEKFNKITLEDIIKKISKPIKSEGIKLEVKHWNYYLLSDLFEIYKGREQIQKCTDGNIPLVSAKAINNGIAKYVTGKKMFAGNKLTVASNGLPGETFYQENDFFATSDVNVLSPKFVLNKYAAFFISTIIRLEKFRFNYGIKWSKRNMEKHKIKLPSKDGKPDFEFMENYIKSLPYSSSL